MKEQAIRLTVDFSEFEQRIQALESIVQRSIGLLPKIEGAHREIIDSVSVFLTEKVEKAIDTIVYEKTGLENKVERVKQTITKLEKQRDALKIEILDYRDDLKVIRK